jgi:hypothetical protein
MLRLPGCYSHGALPILAALLMFATMPAQAELVTDSAKDFLGTYLGPTNGDMDALSSEVTLNTANSTLTFSGTVAGPIGTTSGGAWVWGLDRGKGTEQFLNGTPPFGAGVKFDSVVALFADRTGAFVDIIKGTPPQSLPAGSVNVSGDTISATVPLSMIPSEGFASQKYTWNFWPEAILASPRYVSDFAPDARNATLTVVPEPSSLLLFLFGLVAFAVRLTKK